MKYIYIFELNKNLVSVFRTEITNDGKVLDFALFGHFHLKTELSAFLK
jgi:hypothetical protein